jgi:chemotaxis protein MotB
LRVPQAPEPVTAPEPVVEREPVIASEPVAAAEPAPPKPSAQDLLNELPLDKLGQDIEVVTNDSSVSFRISSEILFPSGQSDLNLGGLAVLQHLIPVLDSVPHKVIVAGHTDTQDMRSARFLQLGTLQRPRRQRGALPAKQRHPAHLPRRHRLCRHPALSNNTTAEGRARNRRVELILER